jgi:hypothetical protein
MAHPPGDSSGLPDGDGSRLLIIVTGLFLFLALSCYSARLYVRLRVLRFPWWDDWTLLFAAVSFLFVLFRWKRTAKLISNGPIQILLIGEWCLLVAATRYGFGRYEFFSHPNTLSRKLIWSCLELWCWSITFIKISIALMLLRIKHTKPWRIGLGIMIAIQAVAAFLNTLLNTIQCRPMSALFHPTNQGGTCAGIGQLGMS